MKTIQIKLTEEQHMQVKAAATLKKESMQEYCMAWIVVKAKDDIKHWAKNEKQ